MKNLILIMTVLLLASCSSSKNGVRLTGFQFDDNYWHNQSHKIVHRNQRYARMEARAAEKEDRMMKNILKVQAKEKKRDKKYMAMTFDHH